MSSTVDTPWPEAATAELRTATPDRCVGYTVDRDVGIPMRDGVRLSANVFRPTGAQGTPAVLIRLPYGKDDHPTMWARGKYWARKGYACVIQDVRGKFGSEGDWVPFVNEAADGIDTLDWLAAQPWCDGSVGMAGESYHGYTQWAVAAAGHPALKCIAPGGTTPDPYLMAYRGGALHLPIAVWACVMEGRVIGDPARYDPWHLPLATMDAAMGLPSTTCRAILAHPARDAFWQALDTGRRFSEVRIPVLHWGGWYDVLLGGTLAGWSGMHAAAAEPRPRAEQCLVIGPTDHALTPAAYGGGRAPEDSPGAWSFDRVQRFFDRWLRGEDEGENAAAPVSVFVMGAERWLEAAAWPLPETRFVDLYLHSDGHGNTASGDGRLSVSPPADELADHFVYDPQRPVDVWLGEDAWELTWTLRDRAEVERRSDVLVYTSSTLDDDLEVTGHLRATLYASSSAADTDFCASLVDVFPDGRTCLIQEGIVRARYRSSELVDTPLTPGEVVEYVVGLWSTSYLFAARHRVRLEVSSSIFGRYDRNFNTGRAARDATYVSARQDVYHDRTHPSHITLPVIPPATGALAAPAGGATRD